jgi:hypothetical protein
MEIQPAKSRGAQPGNKNSVKENREYRAALLRTVKQYEGRGIARGDALRAVTEKLLELALDGELPAIKEVADRMDGRPAQAIHGEEGQPPVITFEWKDNG